MNLEFDGVNWVEVAPKVNDSMLLGFKGQSTFDSPLVYTPYIPSNRTKEEQEIHDAIHDETPKKWAVPNVGSKIQLL